jgi:TonB family protein
MTRVSILFTLIIAAVAGKAGDLRVASSTERQTVSGHALRVAVIGFLRSSGETEAAIFGALSRDGRVMMLDQSLIASALKGVGHDGSINLSRDEARRVGSALGCDFFITGKAEAILRSAGDSYGQALVGVMIVDAPSGRLASFDFIEEKAATPEQALGAAAKSIARRAVSWVDQMTEFRAARQRVTPPAEVERVEDLPEEGSPRAAGFRPPEMLNRIKPEYTEEAESADISATVEASVVFSATGEVGRVEITRWAGFGLDESAIKAIRQLKFKPATRDGAPVSVRATVQYNFRRVEKAGKNPDEGTAPPSLINPFSMRDTLATRLSSSQQVC